MIPIFVFNSLCAAVGLLHLLFPGLFPALAPLPLGAAYGVRGAYRATRNLVQDILFWGTTALVIWLALIAFAIYHQSWLFACTAFVSMGLSVLALTILMSMARAAVTVGTAHINATAKAWSAAIPLQTVPFSRQTYKLGRVLASPLYGLYLLLVLPLKGVLEVVKAVTAFGTTLSSWMHLWVEILAATSVGCWTLVTIVMIQLQHGVVILTLPMLGACLVIIALLVSLIYLGFAPTIKVKDFIAFLGYSGILMSVVFILGVLMPQMTFTLAHTLADLHTQFIANLQSDLVVRMIVGLTILLGLFNFVVWIRPAAPYVAAIYVLLCFWGTNVSLVQKTIPVEVGAGNPVYRCNSCVKSDGTVDTSKVGGLFQLPYSQWYIADSATSPKPVEFRYQRFLLAHPAVGNKPRAGYLDETWLVAWDGTPFVKTAGLNALSKDWTDYAPQIITVVGLLAAAVISTICRRRKKIAPEPVPANQGGGHGGH